MPLELSQSGPASHRGDPSEKARITVEEDVNYTTATPSEYDMWLRYASSALTRFTSWNYAFSGGKGMSYNLAREFLSLKTTKLRIFNRYGPAETTILSTKIGLPDPIPRAHKQVCRKSRRSGLGAIGIDQVYLTGNDNEQCAEPNDTGPQNRHYPTGTSTNIRESKRRKSTFLHDDSHSGSVLGLCSFSERLLPNTAR